MRFYIRPLIVVACLVASDCAHTPQSFRDYHASQPVALTAHQDGPEVDVLVGTFYETAFDPKALHAQLAQVLARYPHASRAHEVAAYLALLDADHSAAFDHFALAASDLESDLTGLYLCANISVEDYAGFRRAASELEQRLHDEVVFTREPGSKRKRPAGELASH